MRGSPSVGTDDAPSAREAALLARFEPVVVATVRRKMAVSLRADDTSARNQDALEMANDARAAVVAWLRSGGHDADLQTHVGYVAALTRNVCAEYQRRRSSDWARLKNRVRYLLRHDARLALWPDQQGSLVCGFSRWHGMDVLELPADALDTASSTSALTALVPAVFMRTGGPVELDALVELLADHLGIPRGTVSVDAPDGAGAVHVADSSAPIDRVLVGRSQLASLWREVCALPIRQRIALLFNLRDESGGDALGLLAVTGVAHVDEIAPVVGLSAKDLAELLPRLPLPDAEIAERLSVERQQVINLRKAGRARLVRRFSAEQALEAR